MFCTKCRNAHWLFASRKRVVDYLALALFRRKGAERLLLLHHAFRCVHCGGRYLAFRYAPATYKPRTT